jgi:hypothetical protein
MDAVVQSAIIKVAGDWALAKAKGATGSKSFIENFKSAYDSIATFLEDKH